MNVKDKAPKRSQSVSTLPRRLNVSTLLGRLNVEKTVLVIFGMKTLVKTLGTWDGNAGPITTLKTFGTVTLKLVLGTAWLNSHVDRRTCLLSPFVVTLLMLEFKTTAHRAAPPHGRDLW